MYAFAIESGEPSIAVVLEGGVSLLISLVMFPKRERGLFEEGSYMVLSLFYALAHFRDFQLASEGFERTLIICLY